MSVKVYIDGREGTTGLKIHARLGAREDIELLYIPDEYRKDPAVRKEYINGSDITFLCLPDAAAREAVALAGDRVRIIDASTAHRVSPGWAYGFPELGARFRENIASGNRIAVPGCHASGFIALVYPLVKLGFMSPDFSVCATSLTGYSGGGKKMIAAYEGERGAEYDAPRMYGIGQTHKHLPEMRAVCGLNKAPVFLPIVSDYYSGMEVILPLDLACLKGVASADELRGIYKDFYAGAGLVKVQDAGAEGASGGGFAAANKLSGRDDMEIYVAGSDERAVAYAVFDNLGKGASGAAVQNMNIMLGLDEKKGLITE